MAGDERPDEGGDGRCAVHHASPLAELGVREMHVGRMSVGALEDVGDGGGGKANNGP